MLNRRSLLLGAAAAVTTSSVRAQTPAPGADTVVAPDLLQPSATIDLWPGGAPGMADPAPVEIVNERSTDPTYADRAVSGIAVPRMVVFRPPEPNGAAIVLTPGGGYKNIVIDKEGHELARWLAARGVTVFVLYYRLPGEGWSDRANVALADAQRAMRLVRRHAADYEVDPDRVGAMGFSAGGHVCADLAARFESAVYRPVDDADRLSARPTLAAPIYPVISMSAPLAHAGSRSNLLGDSPSPADEEAHSPHRNVPEGAPPHFLLHAEDDGAVPVANSLALRAALVQRGVPVETHLFAHGGHGFGLRYTAGKPVAAWPSLFLEFAKSVGLLLRPA